MINEEYKYCVTFVHGTYAHGILKSLRSKKFDFEQLVPVSWAEPDSPMVKAITAELCDQVTFRHFGWNGRNNHGARLQSSKKLAGFLKKTTDELPNARHYLVCHSHGGNVALLALRDIDGDLADKVKGVACLATPFLVFNKRPLELSAFGSFFALLVLMAGLLALGMGALLLGYLFIPEVRENAGGLPLLFISLLLASGVYILAYYYLRERAPVYLKKKQREMYDSFLLPDLNERLRVIRSTGDEATMALVLGQFVSWFTENVWAVVSLLARLLNNLFTLIGFGVIVAIVHYAHNNFGLSVPILDSSEGMSLFPFFLYALLAFFAFFVSVQLILGLVLVSSSALRFGLSHPLVGVLMRTTAEATPLGKVTSVLIANYDEGTKWLGLFRSHTRVYEDPNALEDLVKWIGKRDSHGGDGKKLEYGES